MTTAVEGIVDEVAKHSWEKVLIFTENGKTLYSNAKEDPNEINAFLRAFDKYEDTMSNGLRFEGLEHDVHRFYDNLIYGRRGDESSGNGIGISRTTTADGKRVYCVVTYVYPVVSAKAVAQLRDFTEGYCEYIPLLDEVKAHSAQYQH